MKEGLTDRLLRTVLRKFTDEPIKDVVVEGRTQMRRYHLTPKGWKYRLYLHHITDFDLDRAPHDHPWSFLSIPLWGWYVEAIRGRGFRLVFPGRVIFNRASHTHRIVAVRSCWTLVVAGPQVRTWGFYEGDGTPEARWVAEADYKKRGKDVR